MLPYVELQELAPEGNLRIAIAVAPTPSPFFAAIDPATGGPAGVTVSLGLAMAREFDIPAELVSYPNSGELTEAAANGEWDVAFMPKDEERAKKVDFGPAYFIIESTYLVHAGSPIRSIAEVNRPGIRVIGIANTTTVRSVRRTAPQATVEEVRSVGEMLEMARSGQADAFALSHDAFASLLPQVPGARVLDGHFQAVGVCVAVPKNRPVALRYVGGFVERGKGSGLIRRALNGAGFNDALVAPAQAG